MKRRSLSRKKSQRTFKKGARPFNHHANRATPQRGGIRL